MADALDNSRHSLSLLFPPTQERLTILLQSGEQRKNRGSQKTSSKNNPNLRM